MTTAPHSPQRKTRRVIVAAAALLIVIGAALIWWMNRDVEAQAPILATNTPIAAAQHFVAVPAESQLKIVIDSRFGEIEGFYQLDESPVELEPAGEGWYVVVNLTFDARTLDIGSDQLNTPMRAALEVEKYPIGIFVARSETPVSDFSTPQAVQLTGQLELHGSVQTYTIPTEVQVSGDKLTLAARITINTKDFGINIPALIAESDLAADMLIVAYQTASGAE